jgi:very-short-patch-repair endonuclease
VWHSGRTDVQRNSGKQNLLVARGWRVLRFTWFDVTHRPAYVVATVERLLSCVA